MKAFAKNPAELVVLANPSLKPPKTIGMTKTEKKAAPKKPAKKTTKRRNPSDISTSNIFDSLIDGAVVVGGLIAGTQAAKFVADLIPAGNTTMKQIAAVGIPAVGGTLLVLGGNSRLQKMGVGMAASAVLSGLKMIAPKLAFIPIAGEIIENAVNESNGYTPMADEAALVALPASTLGDDPVNQQLLAEYAEQPLVMLAETTSSGLLEDDGLQTF